MGNSTSALIVVMVKVMMVAVAVPAVIVATSDDDPTKVKVTIEMESGNAQTVIIKLNGSEIFGKYQWTLTQLHGHDTVVSKCDPNITWGELRTVLGTYLEEMVTG